MGSRRFVPVLIALALSGLVQPARAGATVTVRVESGLLARSGIDPRWRADYGTFEWAEISSEDAVALRAAGVPFEDRNDAHTLVLPRVRFDPLTGVPDGGLPFELVDGVSALHLVQLRGPTKPEWLGQLRARGAEVVQHIAPVSYAVLLDPARLGEVRVLPFVRWAGPLLPGYRFDPRRLEGRALSAVVLGEQDASTLRASAGASSETAVIPFGELNALGLSVRLRGVDLLRALALPTLWSLSPIEAPATRDERSDQISAGNVASGAPVPGYRSWLSTVGVTGEGAVVAHIDTGVDASHPTLLGRVHGCHDYSRTGALCFGPNTDLSGHGTHTAGIVVGTGAFGLAPLDGTDSGGFEYGLGMAPGAKLFVQNYLSGDDRGLPPGAGHYLELNRHSVLGGATISANSWGPSGRPRGYDGPTREFDHAPRDADLRTPVHEPLSFVLSIMNGGGRTSTQGTPDEGKNLLRVGSTKNHRAGNISDLSFTTAHGPALDGRMLPDVVAPGESVVSARASINSSCITPPIDADGAPYAFCTGTSMASPHVSGGAALFTEWYRARSGADPSPALVKAAFVNGAVDLAGRRDANGNTLGHVPDNKQGWGRFDLGNVLGETTKAFLDQTVLLRATGEIWTGTLTPVDPTQPVKITLAWTDAPGHGLGGTTPAWVNDLDLRVTGGQTYLGNSFGSPSTGWSVPGGVRDHRNNVENVYLPAASGPLTVEVAAANIAGDAVPGNGVALDQDFVLVVSNGTLS